jgi:hypothetical protein
MEKKYLLVFLDCSSRTKNLKYRLATKKQMLKVCDEKEPIGLEDLIDQYAETVESGCEWIQMQMTKSNAKAARKLAETIEGELNKKQSGRKIMTMERYAELVELTERAIGKKFKTLPKLVWKEKEQGFDRISLIEDGAIQSRIIIDENLKDISVVEKIVAKHLEECLLRQHR